MNITKYHVGGLNHRKNELLQVALETVFWLYMFSILMANRVAIIFSSLFSPLVVSNKIIIILKHFYLCCRIIRSYHTVVSNHTFQCRRREEHTQAGELPAASFLNIWISLKQLLSPVHTYLTCQVDLGSHIVVLVFLLVCFLHRSCSFPCSVNMAASSSLTSSTVLPALGPPFCRLSF